MIQECEHTCIQKQKTAKCKVMPLLHLNTLKMYLKYTKVKSNTSLGTSLQLILPLCNLHTRLYIPPTLRSNSFPEKKPDFEQI